MIDIHDVMKKRRSSGNACYHQVHQLLSILVGQRIQMLYYRTTQCYQFFMGLKLCIPLCDTECSNIKRREEYLLSRNM
jgi:hypothetical protein